KLRPVTYTLDVHGIENFFDEKYGKQERGEWRGKYDKERVRQTGFIAQEVEDAAKGSGFEFSGVDSPDNDKDFYGLRYAEFVVPLVKATQEQQQIIEDQNAEIEKLESEVDALKAEMQQIREALQIGTKK
ncbi:MAG: hypothetical protein ACPGU4_12955, partial [Flavobacteriales bacterium]